MRLTRQVLGLRRSPEGELASAIARSQDISGLIEGCWAAASERGLAF